MTSAEPSRLGIHHLLPYNDFTDWSLRVAGFALKIEFHRLFQIAKASSRVAPKVDTPTLRHWATTN